MSDDIIQDAQDALTQTLEKAALAEDRQLSSVVRERGEQVARLLAGVLRLPRLYELSNQAFEKPIHALVGEMHALNALMGPIHFVVVEGNIYINDIRIRFDLNNDTPVHIAEILDAHAIGGMSFHKVPAPENILGLVARLAEEPATGNPRKAVAAWLAQQNMPWVEVHPPYQFIMKGEERRAARADVMQAYQKSSLVAGEMFGNLALGRNANTVAVRRVVTELVEMDGDTIAQETAKRVQDRATPASVRHAIQVSNLAILIGRGIGLPEAAISDLGVAAFMHDSGYAAGEDGHPPPFERHGTAGARAMLRQRGFHEARIRRLLVCLQHHRPYDDEPTPALFARIVHIADDFDTLTRLRVGGPLMGPPFALAKMWAARGTEYDPDLMGVFVNALGRFPPGSVLVLEDGRWVMSISGARSRRAFAKPIVKVLRDAQGEPVEDGPVIDLMEEGKVANVVRPR
ncbi:MAG: hypothetical protein H6741_23270 [Alphaproteobacteria bacterium]|nr:hypothetical protein [Alphaproteobacteria bacterium]